jgi:hypothetical protein
MAEYEIVLEEEFEGHSPPRFVLRALFLGDEGRFDVIGFVPLTCKYTIVGSAAGASPLPPIPPHVTSSSSS